MKKNCSKSLKKLHTQTNCRINALFIVFIDYSIVHKNAIFDHCAIDLKLTAMPAREVRLKSNRSLKWRNSKRLTSKQWPDMYGFTVTSGPIPCYVISVERGCPAHRAGICPGDQIVEIDGRNVADMSADNVRSLASASRLSQETDGNEEQLPPKIGVVSCVQYLELTATDPKVGYGLTWSGIRPTVVDGVHPKGPAYKAGVLPGTVSKTVCLQSTLIHT